MLPYNKVLHYRKGNGVLWQRNLFTIQIAKVTFQQG